MAADGASHRAECHQRIIVFLSIGSVFSWALRQHFVVQHCSWSATEQVDSTVCSQATHTHTHTCRFLALFFNRSSFFPQISPSVYSMGERISIPTNQALLGAKKLQTGTMCCVKCVCWCFKLPKNHLAVCWAHEEKGKEKCAVCIFKFSTLRIKQNKTFRCLFQLSQSFTKETFINCQWQSKELTHCCQHTSCINDLCLTLFCSRSWEAH